MPAEPTAVRSVHSGYGSGIKKRVRRRNSGRGKSILDIECRKIESNVQVQVQVQVVY